MVTVLGVLIFRTLMKDQNFDERSICLVHCSCIVQTPYSKYSRTSMAQTLMACLPRLF